MKDLDTLIREDARLILLRALAAQPDERLHSDILRAELERFGIRKTREWVNGEIDWLAEMGAVTVARMGTVVVATLTEKGARHVDRSIVIEGVKRPGRPGA